MKPDKEDAGVEIIKEEKDFLILNKPSGLSVHPDGKIQEYTLAHWITDNFPQLKEVGEPWVTPEGERIERPGIVHRLDKETSGILVVAKTSEMFFHLKKQFQNRQVKKTYKAFVYGTFKDDFFQIDKPIGRSPKDFRRFSAQPGARGKKRNAQTSVRVIEQIGKGADGFAFVNLYPKTGRTHQLRVHLKAIHHPIVCDRLYAPKRECVFGFKRLALHAFSLKFTDLAGKEVYFESQLPYDFQNALKNFRHNEPLQGRTL